MLGKLFGKSSSPSKVDDAVRYFFKFSLHILSREGDGPFNLSESEKYDFRTTYLADTGTEDYGVMFFSRIELWRKQPGTAFQQAKSAKSKSWIIDML